MRKRFQGRTLCVVDVWGEPRGNVDFMKFCEQLRVTFILFGTILAGGGAAYAGVGTYQVMDYGPVIGQAITADWPEGNVANKGLAIRLGEEAAAIFDTDLLRYSVATDGGWIDQRRTDHVTRRGMAVPAAEGREVWATRVQPGWAREGSFEDPRENGRGNLPADWGRYGGYYRHGDDVVVTYTVGDGEIHEFPELFRVGAETLAFVRNFSVGPTAADQKAYLLEGRPDDEVTRESNAAVRIEDGSRILLVRLLDSPEEASLGVDGKSVTLRLGDFEGRRVFRVAVVELPKKGFRDAAAEAAGILLSKSVRDPVELTRGGSPRWDEELETEVKPAVETAGGYVRDRIEVPLDNPWNSWMRLAGFTFFPDGKRAAVSTWNGDVWIVSGFGEEMETVRWKRFASGLFAPMGLVVKDEVIYVVEGGQVSRLHDINGNGEADFVENFNNEGVAHPRSHSLALEVDSEGNFYFFKNGNRTPSSIPDHGALIRLSADGKEREVFANGIRGANTLGIGPGDRILGADQQGNWMPAERIDHYREGGFYGFRRHGGEGRDLGDFERPILWMPHDVNNSAGSLTYSGDSRWGPLAGNWVLGSYGQGTLFTLLIEEIDGVWQGAAVEFPFRLTAGPIRSEVNPLDGQLYIAGMRGWGTRVREDGAIDRIRYTGEPVYLPTALNVEPTGVRLRFSEPLDPASAAPSRFEAERWQYIYSENYGSPEVSFADPNERGRDSMIIESVTLSPDRHALFIELADLRPVMQMRIGYDLLFADGREEENELYQTVNRVRDGRATTAPLVFAGGEGDSEDLVVMEEEPEESVSSGLASSNEAGSQLLEANCRACHQSPGVAGPAPALETSEWAGAGKEPLIRILLHGKRGDGGVMMPFDWMGDDELAEMVSYIQTAWHEGEPVSAEEVARVREETEDRDGFWTAEELERLLEEM